MLLRARVHGFRRMVAETRQEIHPQNAGFTQETLGPVLEVVAEIANVDSITAVSEAERRGLLYAASKVAFSAKIIERRNEKN